MFIRNPVNAAVAAKVVGVLRGVNDQIAYADIEERVGEPVSKYVLALARKDMEQAEPPVFFKCITGIGLLRMSAKDMVADSTFIRRRIARSARRGRKRAATVKGVDYDNLSTAEQIQLSTNMTIFAMTEDLSAQVPKRRAPTTEVPDINDLIRKIRNSGQ